MSRPDTEQQIGLISFFKGKLRPHKKIVCDSNDLFTKVISDCTPIPPNYSLGKSYSEGDDIGVLKGKSGSTYHAHHSHDTDVISYIDGFPVKLS